MALTNEQLVHQMYIAYYQRPADPDGLAYWVNQIEENGSWEAVAGAFGNPENAEYAALYGDKTRAELVTELYLSLFGREPEADGLEYWVNGEGSVHSDQNLGFAIINGAQNDDLDLINNKVAFAELLVAEVDQAGFAELTDVKAALAAVTAETNVADAVADLVTEVSELAGLLAGVTAAENAKAAFLKAVGEALELPGPDGKPRSATETEVKGAPADTAANLAANNFASDANFKHGDTATLTASKLNTAKLSAAEAVADAQKTVNADNEAAGKVAGLLAANAQVQARVEATVTANKADTAALAVLKAANISYETLFDAVALPAVTLDEDDKPQVNPDIEEAPQKAEAAKVLAATVAKAGAEAAVGAALDAQQDAEANLAFIDTLKGQKDALFDALNPNSTNTTEGRGDALTWAEAKAALAVADGQLKAEEIEQAEFDAINNAVNHVLNTENTRVEALNEAQKELKEAQDDQKELLDLIAEYEAAVKAAADLEALVKAVAAAEKAVEDAGYEVISVDKAAVAATAEDDVFLLEEGQSTATIYNFGLQGNDQLFIGAGYTLNDAGDLKAGNDSVLEVFFIQDGANNTKVVLEEKAYGTSEDLLTEITLVGVSAADLTLTDEGFVAVA